MARINQDTLQVAEYYGPVWQGEGPYAGRICHFLRLATCNLTCTWCDTAWCWDRKHYNLNTTCPPQPVDHIINTIKNTHPHLTILTGGEPLMHAHNPALHKLLQATSNTTTWHIETNGTIIPPPTISDHITHWTISPKLTPQGDPHKKRIKPKALHHYANLARQNKAIFKIVATNPDDINQATQLAETYNIPARNMWIMPEGTNPHQLLETARTIANKTLEAGYNLTLRQQTLLYGNQKGK